MLQVLIGVIKTPAADSVAAGVRPQGARNADSLLADHRNVEILLDLLQGEEGDCGCNAVARRVGKCREDVHEILRQTPPPLSPLQLQPGRGARCVSGWYSNT